MADSPTPNEIPDFVPPDLGDLLRQKATTGNPPLGAIPQVHFSRQSPGELCVLIGMLLQQATEKPDHRHMVITLQMVTTVMVQSLKDMLDKVMEDPNSSKKFVGLTSHLCTALGVAEFVIDRTVEAYRNAFDVEFNPDKVSDEFLESLSLSRADYAAWLHNNNSGKRP